MYRLLLISVLLMCPVVAEADTVKLSLKDAIGTALENNSRIKAARFSSVAARQGVESASSRYLPSLALEETLTASNAPVNTFMMKLDEGRFSQNDFQINNLNSPSPVHDFKTALTLQQPLYAPSLSPLREVAVRDAQKSELELEAVRQSVAFQVFQAYLDVQKSAAQLKAADQAVADAAENQRLAAVRTSAGTGLRSDELRSNTHLSQVRQRLISVTNDRTLAMMKLALLTGLSEDSIFETDELSETGAVPVMSEDVIKDALENRVEIRLSHNDLERSDALLTLARSDYLPTVGAFASYQLNARDVPFTADNDAWTAGISLKWQLFDGFRRYSERKRAASGRSAAHEMREAAARDIRYQLRESHVRRDEAAKLLEVARNSVQDAEETVRLLAKRYENSLATMVELLDARTALNQARANLADAGAGYALAGGRVFYMSGTFVKEMLK